MAKTNLIPKSKAKTAYGLLSEIRKLILEEPKRYDQNWDLVTGFGLRSNYAAEDIPQCGTVGCVAGWVCVLKGGRKINPYDVPKRAQKILALPDETFQELYSWAAVPFRRDIGPDRHAQLGAAHIARFQQKYAAQLKSTRV